jgi:hypothetical protein
MTSRFQQLLEQVDLELSQPITNDTVSFIVNEEIALEIPVVEHNAGAILLAPDAFVYNFLSEERLLDNEQGTDTIAGLTDASGQPIKTGAGTPEPQPVQTTFTDVAKGWDKWSQENPMTRTVIGFVPGVAQVAGAADVASSAIQGDVGGALRNLPGAFTGATQKQLAAGVAAYDSYKQGNMVDIAKNALTVAAAGGNQNAAQALKTTRTGQNIAELPQTMNNLGSLAQSFTGTTKTNENLDSLSEAKYQGREVKLGKPMSGDVKKYKVYVKDPQTGNIKKVNFGDKKLSIKRDQPSRRKNFRARHRCATAKDRTSARYWSCRMWSSKPVSKILKGK